MTKLIDSEKAREDLHGILDYLEQNAPRSAAPFVEGLLATCELLCTQPRMGILVERIAPGLRQFTHRRYVIFYRYHEQEDSLRIRRVLHHALDTKRQSFD